MSEQTGLSDAAVVQGHDLIEHAEAEEAQLAQVRVLPRESQETGLKRRLTEAQEQKKKPGLESTGLDQTGTQQPQKSKAEKIKETLHIKK